MSPAPPSSTSRAWAVVAGAAEGLGAAFAEELARRGFDLVLADVKAAELSQLAARLERAGAAVVPVVQDLGEPDAGEVIARACGERPIELLVYNAARAQVGATVRLPVAEAFRVIDVNAKGPLALIAALVPRMIARGRGQVLLVGSNAGLVGHPRTAVYGATKAFLVRLGEALAEELRPSGVKVLVVCPGAIATPAFERSGAELWRPLVAAPAAVAEQALDALAEDGPVVVLGAMNRVVMRALTALPRRFAVRLLDRVMRSTYPDDERQARPR